MNKENLFLGTGWHFPPAFANNGATVAVVTAIEDIKQSLMILFTTEIKERFMHPNYGSGLNQYLHEELSAGTINQIQNTLSEAILYHEPRINVNEINVTVENALEPLLLIDIDFTIRTTNARSNLVYPFYLNEASYGLI